MVRLFNAEGALVYSTAINVKGTVVNKTILLDRELAKGSYNMIIKGEDGSSTAIQVLIQ